MIHHHIIRNNMGTLFKVSDFLDSISRPSTKKQYRLSINRFTKWFGEQIGREILAEEILQMRQDDLTKKLDENQFDYLNRAGRFERELVKYHGETMDRIKNRNSARTYTVGVIQLFNHYYLDIHLSKAQKKISKTTKTTRSFPLTIDHVRQMFDIADHRERVILSLATDLGLRISDFISIKIDDIPSLDEEPPISKTTMTNKEEVIAYGYLSKESVDLLKKYIPTLDKEKNPYLFPNTNGGHISDVWLNELMQRLAVKSGIQMNGKDFTFHCFRKMFLSEAENSGIGSVAGKKLCGKAIPQSDDKYLTTVNLREKFIQLKKYITIQNHFNQKIGEQEALKQAIVDSQERLTAVETENRILRENMDKQGKQIKFLESQFQGYADIMEYFMLNKDKIITSEQDKEDNIRMNKLDQARANHSASR